MLLEMTEIIKQVNSGWTKDQIIRYLYIKLAPFFRKDPNYFFKTPEEQEEIYKKGFTFNGRDIVCMTLCQFYVELFQQFDINTVIVPVTTAKVPLHALLVQGDSGWYYLDPLSDLFKNQYGLRPTYFGIIVSSCSEDFLKIVSQYSLIKLANEYLDEIDEELGFNFLNSYFKLLHRQFSVRNIACQFFDVDKNNRLGLVESKIEFIDKNLINLGSVNGILERRQIYKYLIGQIFDKSEKRFTKICCLEGMPLTIKTGNMYYETFLEREYQEINDGEYHLKRIK